MPFQLDHLAVSANTRDEARAHIEEALGVPMQMGGEHDHFGTHNHLMGLENGLYLEAISINPDAPRPDRPRWFDLDNFQGAPRLTNWICATETMEGLPADLGDAVSLTRGDLRWQMAVPATGILPFDNMHPAIIRWQGNKHPATMLTPTGVTLRQLTIAHPDAEALSARLGPIAEANIVFEQGAPALEATFDTPHGSRVLR